MDNQETKSETSETTESTSVFSEEVSNSIGWDWSSWTETEDTEKEGDTEKAFTWK